MTSQIALVLGGTAPHISLLQHLKKRGFYTLLIDYHQHPIARPFADEHVQISAMDKTEVRKLAKQRRATLVISTCSDQLNLTACEVGASLDLPIPYSPEIALDVTHKVRMKTKMMALGIPTAPFITLNTLTELDLLSLPFPFPVVVKPLDSCGSKGVRKVNRKKALPLAIKEAFALSRDPGVIIEKFEAGREICADCYVQQGVVHVISIYEKFNLFQEDTVIQCFRSLRPVKISPALEQRLHQILQHIAQGFCLENTPLFVQTLMTSHQVRIIEFAARVPGGLAYRATELATGFDAINAGISSFLKETVVIPEPVCSGSYFSTNSIYGKPGIFSHVTGHQELLKAKVIKMYSPYKTAGMLMGPYLSSQDRVAGFIVEAHTKDELFQKTHQAINRLEIYNTAHEKVMLKTPFLDTQEAHILSEVSFFEMETE
jgi:biotin carboxylase